MNKPNLLIKIWDSITKWIPAYAVLSLIACFVFNSLVYTGTQLLMKNAYHYDFTTNLDRSIPFIPAWVVIYLICYFFWGANYILSAREGKQAWYRFLTADLLAKCICGIFFVLLPTTNIRPEITDTDIFSKMMQFVYGLDMPSNLFPSIHCLVSWFSYIGIRRSTRISKWYKLASLLFAVLVCLSTQFTKQHYLVDAAGGIIIAELCYFITSHTSIYKYPMHFFNRINQWLHLDHSQEVDR